MLWPFFFITQVPLITPIICILVKMKVNIKFKNINNTNDKYTNTNGILSIIICEQDYW